MFCDKKAGKELAGGFGARVEKLQLPDIESHAVTH